MQLFNKLGCHPFVHGTGDIDAALKAHDRLMLAGIEYNEAFAPWSDLKHGTHRIGERCPGRRFHLTSQRLL